MTSALANIGSNQSLFDSISDTGPRGKTGNHPLAHYIKFGGSGAISCNFCGKMEDVDDEKLFLEEKIAEMRDRRGIIKTSKPIPAASRYSVVDTMHIASNFSKKEKKRRTVFAH